MDGVCDGTNTACGGCASCSSSGGKTWNCEADDAECGNCGICTLTGTSGSCSRDDDACPGCLECQASGEGDGGEEWNCTPDDSDCDPGLTCNAAGDCVNTCEDAVIDCEGPNSPSSRPSPAPPPSRPSPAPPLFGCSAVSIYGAKDECAPLGDSVTKRISDYVQRKYHLATSSSLQVVEDSVVGRTCYRKIHFDGDVPQSGKFPSFFYVSPDGKFLSTDLLDVYSDPIEEERNLIPERAIKLSEGARNTLGKAGAPVTVVVFSDFQCPYCKRAAGFLKSELENQDAADVRLIFRHIPLAMHPWAREAAVAAQCVSFQNVDAFWKTQDFFFAKQGTLKADNIGAEAEAFVRTTLNLDTSAYQRCKDGDLATDLVGKDIALGQMYRVTGTPTFFVNGRLIRVVKQDDLHAAILEAMIEAMKASATR